MRRPPKRDQQAASLRFETLEPRAMLAADAVADDGLAGGAPQPATASASAEQAPPAPQTNESNTAPNVTILDASPVVGASDGAFQEQSGLVLFEVESQPAAGGWQLQDSVPGFTGEGYYRWEGPNLFGSPGAQGVTQYRLNITNPGTYQLRFHNHRNGGIPFDQENDVWVRMDSGPWIKVFSGVQGQWNWVSNFDFGEGNRPPGSFNLSAGEHTFTISGRSNGFRIDRVALFNTALTPASVAQNLNTPTSSTTADGGDGLTFDLEAAVSDDGEVNPLLFLRWSVDEGPGTAEFSNPNSSATQVTFSEPGAYRVRLTANDGELITSDTRVIVAPPPTGPVDETSFTPVDDATVEGANGVNDGFLKVQTSGPTRTGYLKFDVTGLTEEELAGARLRLVVSQDPGSGQLNLFTGAANNWTEETINAANAPAATTLVDSVSGTHAVGSVVEFDVSSVVTGDGEYTFALRHAGGNDVWFSSKEGASAPQLIVDRQVASLAGDYTGDGRVGAEDYAFWRLSYGSTAGDGLLADGNGDGRVDAADYTIWRDALVAALAVASSNAGESTTGESTTGGSATAAPADEPAAPLFVRLDERSGQSGAAPLIENLDTGGGADATLLLLLADAGPDLPPAVEDTVLDAESAADPEDADAAFADLSLGL